jgi:hypothetical protein
MRFSAFHESSATRSYGAFGAAGGADVGVAGLGAVAEGGGVVATQ